MIKQAEIRYALLKVFNDIAPDKKPSYLFWVNGIAYISKIIDGNLITKEGEKKEDRRWDWK